MLPRYRVVRLGGCGDARAILRAVRPPLLVRGRPGPRLALVYTAPPPATFQSLPLWEPGGLEVSKGYVKDQSAELFKTGEQPNSTGEGHMQAQAGPKAMRWPKMPKFDSRPTH